MKLAALYSVFNGEELLEKSIEQVSPHCDGVFIFYQETSNKGNKSDTIKLNVYNICLRSKAYSFKWSPNLNLNTKENERVKHQFMLDVVRELGFTHFFMAACDHYYLPSEFQKAKQKCEQSNYDVTFTAMYSYYKNPEWRLTPIENYYMPFICKVNSDTAIKRVSNYPIKVDPSVQVTPCKNWYLFREPEIMLHHFTMIRTDIENKFKNAAASIRWTKEQVSEFISEYENAKIGDKIKYFQGRTIIEVPDYFRLNESL